MVKIDERYGFSLTGSQRFYSLVFHWKSLFPIMRRLLVLCGKETGGMEDAITKTTGAKPVDSDDV